MNQLNEAATVKRALGFASGLIAKGRERGVEHRAFAEIERLSRDPSVAECARKAYGLVLARIVSFPGTPAEAEWSKMNKAARAKHESSSASLSAGTDAS